MCVSSAAVVMQALVMQMQWCGYRASWDVRRVAAARGDSTRVTNMGQNRSQRSCKRQRSRAFSGFLGLLVSYWR